MLNRGKVKGAEVGTCAIPQKKEKKSRCRNLIILETG
jgi:hypothetical protein